jgi:hypothetical protein
MSSINDNVTRRGALKTGAGGVLATAFAQENSMATETNRSTSSSSQHAGMTEDAGARSTA